MRGIDRYVIVRAIGVGRLLTGVIALPACGILGWWKLAALLFVAAFMSDMVDGALARRWDVVSAAGGRLDSRADAALTFGALLSLTVGDVWSWWILAVLTAVYVAANAAEPHLKGDALGLLILAVPAANFTLIALVAARLFQLGFGGSFGTLMSVEVGVFALIAWFKRDRVHDYLRMAIDRSS